MCKHGIQEEFCSICKKEKENREKAKVIKICSSFCKKEKEEYESEQSKID